MGDSIHRKLFLLLSTSAITFTVAVFVLLAATGTISLGVEQTEDEIKKDLAQRSSTIEKQLNQIGAYTVMLSEELSKGIEDDLSQKGINAERLKTHPELLENVIGSQFAKSLFSLQRAECSGVFLILDATINPSIENAEYSKAGLYIKNMEPDLLNPGSTYLLILRGSPNIGNEHSISLHSQWRMEFDVKDAPYYNYTIAASNNKDLPVSKLYYWSNAITLPGSSEKVMLCSAPLIDSQGKVFGVCGFEISALHFKSSNMPDTSTYPRIFCLLAQTSKRQIHLNEAFTAGNYSTHDFTSEHTMLAITTDKPFNQYSQKNGIAFKGLHQYISLYPDGSPFRDDRWLVALMVPKEDISDAAAKNNQGLLFILIGLLTMGVILSYFISKHFAKPLMKRIEEKKYEKNNGKMSEEINIQEPNGVLEHTSFNHRIEDFYKQIKMLSQAERAVFFLYAEGYTAKEIAEQLHLSINTIKTHSKHIYSKLNISSREELLLYVNTLKEAGREIK